MNWSILLFTGTLGAVLTFYTSHNLKQGGVKASALLSLLVGLFFYLFPESVGTYLSKHIPMVFIGASFIGMVSSKLIKSYVRIGITGCLFSIIYVTKGHFFDGYGGGLGTLALISLISVMSLSYVISKKNYSNIAYRVRKAFQKK